ncbi:uncharacterized protein LOC107632715 [Arachis ipaensis]|uniref:uncharacterized protein LOC107632715 n=1 Tax=Arachis ipaensis TaxID=130454 RepID=UPI0007AF4410|nr:uncharacterized protein LOC107632715 [Arachis ipaensis]XP_025637411.1 uncharacterized protein LOC112732821 [Arachis hypogaea]
MVLALESKNKFGFVDRTITKPEKGDSLFEPWKRCNTYVVSWLNLSLESSISQSGDMYRVAELQEELCAIRQSELDVTSYYTRLKTIWEELDNFRSIPVCQCGVTFNCGLEVIRSHSLNDVFAMLTQQERQFQSELLSPQIVNNSTPSLNFVESGQNRGRGRGRGGRNQGGRGQSRKVQCAHCGKLGHNIESCYKKHGYPPHLKQMNSGEAAVNYMATAETEEDNEKLSSQLVGGRAVDSGFTAEQRQALLALLGNYELKPIQSTDQIVTQSQSPPHQGNLVHILQFKISVKTLTISNNKRTAWVIDTGVTDHVSYSLDNFQTYHKIDPIVVRLPDGTITFSNTIGTIHFSKNLYLINALYIPSFNYKLVSISKLTDKLHCQMIFNDKLCEIQDCSSMRMIGKAKSDGGLYTLKAEARNLQFGTSINTSCIMNIQGIRDKDLWHYRLGHLPCSGLIDMKKYYNFITYDTDENPCNACHLAKQKLLPFSLSTTKLQHCLDMIHVDI